MSMKKIHMGKAVCAVDLCDGSERGEYVNQDYILSRLGRPHRSINLMYCYYPLDEGWPGRASVVHARDDVSFAWDYPYDDYFTYKGGINGSTDGEPFSFMRDIRRHGQDVTLTLTIDPNVTDDHLVHIAKELRPFGRLLFRINHEATGSWFSFNRRCSYRQVADFFVRFHKIVKKYAPNVSTILCIGGIENLSEEKIVMEDIFAEAVRATDIWSVDKYMSLHYGWPYDVAEKDGTSFYRKPVRDTYEMTKASYERYKFLCGGIEKPMVMSEFNADGDVTGAYEQAEDILEFFKYVEENDDKWFSGFTFYQFRDRGRLGLEIEDPNNKEVGIEQPAMKTYKELIHKERFLPEITSSGDISLPARLRWGGSEDADGIAVPIEFSCNPTFCEVTFSDDSNVMMELNGRWFYKSPSAKTIDLMSAFYDKPLDGACTLELRLFYPPATGENDPAQGDDWAENYYTTVESLPAIRVRFEPIA